MGLVKEGNRGRAGGKTQSCMRFMKVCQYPHTHDPPVCHYPLIASAMHKNTEHKMSWSRTAALG